MNHFRKLGITLMALSMGVGGIASAQDRGPPDRGDRQERRGPPDRNDGSSRWDGRDQRGAPRVEQRGPQYRADHHGPRGGQGYNQRGEWRDHRGEWRGAGPNHNFRRGGYLPPQYRHRQYVVEDWRGHRLSAPPRGYHWVQTGGDYVLAAIATGVILQILLNN